MGLEGELPNKIHKAIGGDDLMPGEQDTTFPITGLEEEDEEEGAGDDNEGGEDDE